MAHFHFHTYFKLTHLPVYVLAYIEKDHLGEIKKTKNKTLKPYKIDTVLYNRS